MFNVLDLARLNQSAEFLLGQVGVKYLAMQKSNGSFKLSSRTLA